ncbi:penicillin acylase family protein [Streptomyces sp. SID12488]|uniref:penicillin acylase family protein n=1 Tax=Streptomyces sp. SID12488 TaxID=2706040 RepID=UPI0013DB6CD2|nr:penicillin acylase family protein [Streptomyces sp. SID12488]NEA67009.1 penicillin acylase family protein [Streptomyces sp. SID12488]
MTRRLSSRLRYGRLWRLPSARAALVPIAFAGAAAATGVVGPRSAVLPVLAVGAVVTGLGLWRHRARLAVELRLVRALLASNGPHAANEQVVAGPTGETRLTTADGGVTRIEAPTWLDAVHALGYVMARDRAFQLDLLRRTAAGRLAEVWGRTALPLDRHHRHLDLAAAADRALTALERPERELLDAFAAGVNAEQLHHGRPFESRFLAYRPEPWTPRDSLLVELFMFHSLSWNEQAKRAEAVIRRALPPHIANFFLPGDLLQQPPLPDDLGRNRAAEPVRGDFVTTGQAVAGSNCWIRGGPDGPVLACDPHLTLTLPNLLYEVDVGWPGHRLRGLAAAGLPAVLTGTNGHIAWGITNLSADVLDLVPLEGEPATRTERIRVRGRDDDLVEVARDGTMPVSPRPLLGQRVAVRWTGHDPRSCDLKFQRLVHALNVEESIRILDDAEGIALNVLVADTAGRMAHLATGLLPRRPAHSPDAPTGHLTGPERPRLVDPPVGFLVSANDAVFPQKPFRVGYDLDPGYRARRVRAVLARETRPDAHGMRALQHDTTADLYVPYRDLAVASLGEGGLAGSLASWDGTADVDSVAFGVLVRFREILARKVLSPYLEVCRDLDPDFLYAFRAIDTPVLEIVGSKDPSLLPRDEEANGWPGFIARCALQAAADLSREGRRGRLPKWGDLNAVGLNHPLVGLAPWAAPLLGVQARPQGGALHSVRTCVPGFAAAGRAILTPRADGFAEFDVPGGQSGHPLSPHFTDRHKKWSTTFLPQGRNN